MTAALDARAHHVQTDAAPAGDENDPGIARRGLDIAFVHLMQHWRHRSVCAILRGPPCVGESRAIR